MTVMLSFLLPERGVSNMVLPSTFEREIVDPPSMELALVSCAQSWMSSFGIASQDSPSLNLT